MARKTYHHLAVGQAVIAQFVQWEDVTCDVKVRESFKAVVTENRPDAKTLKLEVEDCFRNGTELSVGVGVSEHVSISKQSGMEWGSYLEGGCFRIDPVYAAKKGMPA